MSSSNPEKPKSDHERRERQDWGIVLLILLIGFLCVLVAGQQAMSFAPRWTLDANVESNIDLNSEFLTSQPDGYFEPLDPAILTQPGWASVFLTPGAPIPVGTSVAASAPTGTTAAEPTATLLATNTLPVIYTSTTIPTNTLVWIPIPATNTPKPKDPPADPPTDTPIPPPPIIDLHLAMEDGITSYGPGDTVTYTITITSSSTVDVTGATVTDFLSAQLIGTSWSCVTDLGTACGTGGGNLNSTFTIPTIPGAFVRYIITGTVHASAAGPLVNTASVSVAADINPGDNTVTDSNGGPNAGPGGEIEIGPGDSDWIGLGQNTSIVMVVSPAIRVDGNGDDDLVFYERIADPSSPVSPPATDPRVDLDAVRVRISMDGSTWYTVFYWGDGTSDTNTTVALPVDTPPDVFCAAETDNCQIPIGNLYNSTGIAINVDIPGIPAGSYSWIEIYSPGPPADTDNAAEVNSIQVLP